MKVELEKQIFYQVYQKMGYSVVRKLIESYFINKTDEKFAEINLQNLSIKLNILLKKLNKDKLEQNTVKATNVGFVE